MDEMGEPNSKEDDQDRPAVHYAGGGPCKQLFQDALIAILKCLGFQGGAGLHPTSSTTPAAGEKKKKKNEDEKEADSSAELDPSSLPTGQVRGGGDAVSSAVDPPAADDPPPSTQTVENEVTTRAFRAPPRLPVRTGAGPHIN